MNAAPIRFKQARTPLRGSATHNVASVGALI